MSDNLKHAKVTTTETNQDGTTTITTESYFEKLSHRKQEIEKHIPVSRRNVLSELISCLDVITQEGSPELTITIKSRSDGEPYQLSKRWVASKEDLGKK